MHMYMYMYMHVPASVHANHIIAFIVLFLEIVIVFLCIVE